MKSILVLLSIFSFSLFSAQKSQEFIFKFNVKKWNRAYQKQQKISKDQSSTISLFDVYGKEILFKIKEKSISEKPIENLKVFKGKSADDKKIISLSISPKSLSGSYLENGQQFFIEPVKNACNRYKVYIHPKIDKDVEVGQIKDYVE